MHRRVRHLIPDIMTALSLTNPHDYPMESVEVEEDIVVALLKAWAELRDFNRVPTDAGVRQNLEKLLNLPPEHIRNVVMHTDGNTRSHIINAWPGGDGNSIFSEAYPDDPERYLEAVQTALGCIPKPGRGRPAATRDEAVRSLASSLGDLYHQKTSNRPTRHHDGIEQREIGPFHAFVGVVLRVIPDPILEHLFIHARNRNNIVDYVARMGVEIHAERMRSEDKS
jgi:hypothetical protein